MGFSLGELFVKLGFEVDDSKLKSFDQSIQSVFSGIKEFAGLAGVGVGVAGFTALAKASSDTALTIENLTRIYGVSAKAIQGWAAAVHENNPLKSLNEGIASFGTMAGYLNNASFSPQGAMALNRLGVKWDSSMIGHPEKIIDQLFQSVPNLLRQNPNYRGLYSQLIGQVTGDAANIGIFERGPAWAAGAAARGTVSDEDIAKQAQARRNISEMSDLWDKFVGHVMGTLGGGVVDLHNNIEKQGWLAGIGQSVDDLGAANPFGLGGHSLFDSVASGTKNLIGNENAKGLVRRLGWSSEQAQGIVARLMKESGLNPSAVGDNGQAYGIAQWHPDRQREFSRVMGKDIHGSSIEEQLAFMNYELTKGNERSAGDKLRGTKSAEDAYKQFTNNYERPAVKVEVTQNIHTNDPQAAAEAARREFQQIMTTSVRERLAESY